MGQGVLAMKRTAGESVLAKEADAQSADHKKKIVRILGVLVLCAVYYVVLGEVSIPRVTIGILSFSITISIFELATIIFLIAMMWFYESKKSGCACAGSHWNFFIFKYCVPYMSSCNAAIGLRRKNRCYQCYRSWICAFF